MFSILSLISSFFVFSFDRNGVFPSEAMTELEHLHAVVDTFLDFLGVAPGAQEERLWNTCCRVLDNIESGIRHGTGIALAMVEVSVEADLTRINSFPVEEELRHHEDLVACYSPMREAVAGHVPVAEVLARLPLIRVFSVFCFACGASAPFLFCNGPFMMN
jgi:hypothetical protein